MSTRGGAKIEPPLSADEFIAVASRNIGTSFDDVEGMTVAYMPKDSRRAESYINIRKRRDDEPPQWKLEPNRAVEVEPRYDAPAARITIAGQSGSGKSHWTGKYVKRLVGELEQPVYLLSRVSEDPVLDDVPGLVRINPATLLADTLENGPMPVEDFKESVMITDDLSSLPAAEKAVAESLRSDILEIGRHSDITALNVVHVLFDGTREGKRCLIESSAYTIFPRASGIYSGTRLLKEYMGLSPKHAKSLLNVKSRWLYLQRQYPAYAVWEGGVTLM